MAIGLGLLIRMAVVFSFPNLSNDIYRFLWDGHLIHEGISPLLELPSTLIKNPSLVDGYLEKLFPLLNSPDYYTVYPPISQLVYYLATISEDWSYELSSIFIKSIMLAADAITCFLLLRLLPLFKLGKSWVLAYFLNPLLIIEGCGQLHFEGIMVMFLAGMILAIAKYRWVISGVMLALSVGTKLLPLMFVPALAYYAGRNLLKALAGFSVVSLLLFIPYFWGIDLANFMTSINLYAKSFEFNSSFYFVLRSIGYWLTGYNQIGTIGPLLRLLTLVIILFLVFKCRPNSLLGLVKVCFLSFTTYLFLATTVHPWYLIMLIFFSVLLKKRWVWVWSGVVVLSYSTYIHDSFEPNLGLIVLEYAIVIAAIIYEYRNPIIEKA